MTPTEAEALAQRALDDATLHATNAYEDDGRYLLCMDASEPLIPPPWALVDKATGRVTLLAWADAHDLADRMRPTR